MSTFTNKPKFAIGDTVKHLPTHTQGKVVGIVNELDLKDVTAQGFRYTIDTRLGLRSTTEASLKSVGQK